MRAGDQFFKGYCASGPSFQFKAWPFVVKPFILNVDEIFGLKDLQGRSYMPVYRCKEYDNFKNIWVQIWL